MCWAFQNSLRLHSAWFIIQQSVPFSTQCTWSEWWWAVLKRVCRRLGVIPLLILLFLFLLYLLFSHEILSNSLWPHGLQHTRFPCPSLSPWVCSNPRTLSQWCLPIISSSVVAFSSCPQSFPTSRSFPTSWLFISGGQSIRTSVLPINIQNSFNLGLTGLISLQSKGLSRVFSSSSKASILQRLALFQLSHPYMTTGKTMALTMALLTFVSKVMSLFFNILSRFVIALLPRGN